LSCLQIRFHNSQNIIFFKEERDMKFTKMLAIITALMMVLSLVAACGGGDETTTTAAPTNDGETTADEGETTEPAPDAEPVEILHWYWADTPEYSETFQEMVADFNSKNPDIKVVAEEQPWDGGGYGNTLLTTVMGGGGPDTSAWKLTWTPAFAENDKLLALDDMIAGWDKKDEILENLYEVMKVVPDGKTYVMPWNWQVLYVYYRPSMFEEAEVEVPTTYEDFLAACETLTRDTDGDGQVDVYGFGMRGAKGGQEPWGSFIHATGGDFMTMDSPEAIAGMQDFIDLYKNGFTPPTAPADGFNEIINNFKSGLTAMTVHHIGSSVGMVETFGDDVDAFPFPGSKGQWTSMGDTENVIFAETEHPEESFRWLAYLAAEEGQETWCQTTGNVPVSKTVQELPFFQDNKFMAVSIEGAPYAGILPVLDTTTPWINDLWPATVQRALAGEISAEEAMQTLQEGMHS
jgi:multiple sugar transport system substrate-binding protein